MLNKIFFFIIFYLSTVFGYTSSGAQLSLTYNVSGACMEMSEM